MSIQLHNKNIFFITLISALFIITYYQVIQHLLFAWSVNPDYSHGYLIPIISFYMAWSKRHEVAQAEYSPNNWGLLLLVLGIGQYIIGYIGAEHFLQSTSILVVICGIILFLGGVSFVKVLLAPVLFLIFMIPLPAIIWKNFAFTLKLFATKAAVILMEQLGMVVLREGNVLYLPGATLEVVDACSGLRSLVSLLALSTLIAFFSTLPKWKKTILVFSSIPVALVSNIIRIVITALLVQSIGPQATEGIYHSLSGLFVFTIGVMLFYFLHLLLSWKSGLSNEVDK